MPADERPLVVVAGAGLTGLATAWHLQQSGAVRIVVVEATDDVGGKIATASVAATEVDAGPDCFLARVPWAAELCREVGLDDLVAPATSAASIWSGGRLRRLPEGLVLGVPTSATALARSRLLSIGASVRAAADLVRPASPVGDADPSIADVVGRRLGRGVVDRLVEPLLGGINAGRADRLSATAVAPQIAAAARSQRSLILALRAQRKAAASADGPVFLAPRAGMRAVPARLRERLLAAGVELRAGTAIETLTAGTDGRVNVFPTGLFADHVVLTTPAHVAAAIVQQGAPAAAEIIGGIQHASIAIVLLAYRADSMSLPAQSGFLVPRGDGRLLTACSFLSNKWPHLAPPGHVVLRASVGHIDDDRAITMADDDLVAGANAEIAEALRVPSDVTPADATVVRWPNAFPQYEPGHADRVARLRELLAAALPNVSVAGAAYDGLGLAACARQGAEAAKQILQTLR